MRSYTFLGFRHTSDVVGFLSVHGAAVRRCVGAPGRPPDGGIVSVDCWGKMWSVLMGPPHVTGRRSSVERLSAPRREDRRRDMPRCPGHRPLRTDPCGISPAWTAATGHSPPASVCFQIKHGPSRSASACKYLSAVGRRRRGAAGAANLDVPPRTGAGAGAEAGTALG